MSRGSSGHAGPAPRASFAVIFAIACVGASVPFVMVGCPGTSDPGVDPSGCVRMPGCETTSQLCCDETLLCQQHICQGVAWICSRDPNGTFLWVDRAGPCDDGNPCTVDDTCVGGSCRGTPTNCDSPPAAVCADANKLRTYTAGQCNPANGQCAYKEQLVNCPQGCQAGQCQGDPCIGVKCDKPPGACFKNPGTCDSNGKCKYDPLPVGTQCDTGDKCSTNGQCDAQGACKGSGVTCQAAHASGATCVQGECQGFKCDNGWDNCNNDWKDGCETNIASSVSNCGQCGKKCSAGAHATAKCENMTCKLTCTSPWRDCNNKASDGCEIPVGQANRCNRAGLTGAFNPNASTPGCGTPRCGTGSGNVQNFGTWHCAFCSHCNRFADSGGKAQYAWCLSTPDGNFSPARCETCCGSTSKQTCP